MARLGPGAAEASCNMDLIVILKLGPRRLDRGDRRPRVAHGLHLGRRVAREDGQDLVEEALLRGGDGVAEVCSLRPVGLLLRQCAR